MTTATDLLPLPPLHIVPSVEPVDYPDVAQALMDYARANVAHATAAQAAEIEALRAEVERLQSDTSFATAISSLRREKERAERLAEALRWAERHCPCGARPESPNTHPHIPGCPVGAALHPTTAQEEGNGQ